jgi:hypothetical protein
MKSKQYSFIRFLTHIRDLRGGRGRREENVESFGGPVMSSLNFMENEYYIYILRIDKNRYN